MAQINDLIFEKLVAFDGTVNDKLLAWLQSLGATSAQLNDAWVEVIGTPSINDGQLAFYKAGGATSDNLSDAKFEFWEAF